MIYIKRRSQTIIIYLFLIVSVLESGLRLKSCAGADSVDHGCGRDRVVIMAIAVIVVLVAGCNYVYSRVVMVMVIVLMAIVRVRVMVIPMVRGMATLASFLWLGVWPP